MKAAQLTAAQLEAALPERHTWTQRPTTDDLKPLTNTPAVYLLTTEHDQPVLLATTQQLRRLVNARLAPPEDEGASTRADLGAIARAVRWRSVSGPFEARWWYWRLARQLYPREYRKLVGFGSAWWLWLDMTGQVPEIRVSERLTGEPQDYLGPWPSRRSATQAVEGLWDLFDLCRYPEQVRKAPAGQRCAYADMGRCDAPCDGSASLMIYTQRVRAAWAFADGGVQNWMEQAKTEMRLAAQQLAFERAGLLKEQIAFAQKWAGEWSPSVTRLTDWSLLLLMPVTRRKAWKPFWFEAGRLWDGPIVQSRALLKTLAQWESEPPTAEVDALQLAEDQQARTETCWLVAHLLFGSDRERVLILRRKAGKLLPGWEASVTARLQATSEETEADQDPNAGEPPELGVPSDPRP